MDFTVRLLGVVLGEPVMSFSIGFYLEASLFLQRGLLFLQRGVLFPGRYNPYNQYSVSRALEGVAVLTIEYIFTGSLFQLLPSPTPLCLHH